MVKPETWDELRLAFRRVALREGITHVAREIPADRGTVYRLIDGTTRRPTRAVRAGVERIVRDRSEHPTP